MKILSFDEAQNDLTNVLDSVRDGNYTLITRSDNKDAVVMSLKDFNGIMETLYLISNPTNAAHLQSSIEQYKSND